MYLPKAQKYLRGTDKYKKKHFLKNNVSAAMFAPAIGVCDEEKD